MTAITVHDETAQIPGASPSPMEPLFTIKAAAEMMGIKYWLLLQAVNQGSIPSYRFGNSRRRVRVSDIEAVLQASRN